MIFMKMTLSEYFCVYFLHLHLTIVGSFKPFSLAFDYFVNWVDTLNSDLFYEIILFIIEESTVTVEMKNFWENLLSWRLQMRLIH